MKVDFTDKEMIAYKELLIVRRHIAVGANRFLFSVYLPTRSCRIGTYRRFRAE